MEMYDITNYRVPTKQPLPCLHYDLAVYCDYLMQAVHFPFPKYLERLEAHVISYAAQIERCKLQEFPAAYRVYLVDYRLNFLFAGLDTTGRISAGFSYYSKQAHKTTDCYYGDGSLIGGTFPGQISPQMVPFMEQYGFLPVEELASPAALVYERDQLVERRPLSQYQMCILLEQFRSENIIDWKKRIAAEKEMYPL